jgi:hypothetical protein
VGRPNKAETFRPFVEEILAREPSTATRDLLAQARRAGYAGGKTAFYALVARARHVGQGEDAPAAPGERSHHDIGEADVRLAHGERRRVRFFVSRLVYSGWVTASLIEDDGAEQVARALVDHFALKGGVPHVARFERARPVADERGARDEIVLWNMAFAYLATELGIGLEVRRPRALGKRVKDAVFRGNVFADRAHVAACLTAYCDEVDLRTPSDAREAAGATPSTLLADERRRLRPLAVAPADLELREPVFVGARGAVVHGTHVYSMPAAAAGRMGVILLGRERVRIVAGPFEATHPRLVERGARSILPEHGLLT